MSSATDIIQHLMILVSDQKNKKYSKSKKKTLFAVRNGSKLIIKKMDVPGEVSDLSIELLKHFRHHLEDIFIKKSIPFFKFKNEDFSKENYTLKCLNEIMEKSID